MFFYILLKYAQHFIKCILCFNLYHIDSSNNNNASNNNINNNNDNNNKYKDLEIEVGKLWHMKTVTHSVVIGTLGMIKKGTEKNLEKIPGSPNLAKMQKIALIGTAYILRKTLFM